MPSFIIGESSLPDAFRLFLLPLFRRAVGRQAGRQADRHGGSFPRYPYISLARVLTCSHHAPRSGMKGVQGGKEKKKSSLHSRGSQSLCSARCTCDVCFSVSVCLLPPPFASFRPPLSSYSPSRPFRRTSDPFVCRPRCMCVRVCGARVYCTVRLFVYKYPLNACTRALRT